ncbi:MAG: hypothetical protein ABJA71_08000 [Ginsengibacter sp.]
MLTTQNNNSKTMQNPVDQYPKPPYPEQQQEAPGFEGQMQPKADHGETLIKARVNLPAVKQ